MFSLNPRVLTAAAAIAVASTTLGAQTSNRPSFGVFGGAAFPTADFRDFVQSGYNVGAFLGFKPAVSPVGLRLEGAYNRFDIKNDIIGVSSDAHTNVFSGTANIVVQGSSAPGMVRPYLIGGVGIYNSKDASSNGSSESDTKFGINGGAGIDLPLSGIAVFIEARYHYVFTKDNDVIGTSNTGFVPVVVGLRF